MEDDRDSRCYFVDFKALRIRPDRRNESFVDPERAYYLQHELIGFLAHGYLLQMPSNRTFVESLGLNSRIGRVQQLSIVPATILKVVLGPRRAIRLCTLVMSVEALHCNRQCKRS